MSIYPFIFITAMLFLLWSNEEKPPDARHLRQVEWVKEKQQRVSRFFSFLFRDFVLSSSHTHTPSPPPYVA